MGVGSARVTHGLSVLPLLLLGLLGQAPASGVCRKPLGLLSGLLTRSGESGGLQHRVQESQGVCNIEYRRVRGSAT